MNNSKFSNDPTFYVNAPEVSPSTGMQSKPIANKPNPSKPISFSLSDGDATQTPPVFNAPTVVNITPGPSGVQDGQKVFLFQVTTAVTNIYGTLAYEEAISMGQDPDSLYGAIQFSFEGDLPAGSTVQLRCLDQVCDSVYLAQPCSSVRMKVHQIGAHEVRYFEMSNSFLLVITCPDEQDPQVATPGGVGLVIVANIGGGDGGNLGNAFIVGMNTMVGARGTTTKWQPDRPSSQGTTNPNTY